VSKGNDLIFTTEQWQRLPKLDIRSVCESWWMQSVTEWWIHCGGSRDMEYLYSV